MFDEKTILARLQNGEDAQSIANEMAAMINTANKAYADQKAKEEEARKAEELKKAKDLQKKADLQDILDQASLWFAQYYGIDAGDELKAETIMELIDGVQEYIDALKGLEMVIGKRPAVKVVKSGTELSADEAINQFLKRMGW